MEQLAKKTDRVRPEELLARFRSKEDLYRYLVNQGKFNTPHIYLHSQCLPPILGGDQVELPQRHPRGEEASFQAERDQSHADPSLPGALSQEPLRGCNERPCRLKVSPVVRIAGRQAS